MLRIRRVADGLRRAAVDGPLATVDDVRACYRLLLQREPDREGFRHQLSHVGVTPLHELVRSFLESPEFQDGALCRAVFRYDEQVRLFQLPGFALYAWPADTDIGAAFVDGAYEPHVTRSLRTVLRPGMVVADLGANIGYFTMLAASIVGPGGRVIAFEAGRANADLARASARHNGFAHVEVHHRAVLDAPGIVELHHARGSNAYVASAGDGTPGGPLARVEQTTAVRLDDALAGLDRLDVVKIDVEGAEHRAILGGARTLERLGPVVFTEFSPDALHNVSDVDGATYLRWFVDRGYSVSVIGHDHDVAFGADVPAVLDRVAATTDTHIDLRLDPPPDAPGGRR